MKVRQKLGRGQPNGDLAKFTPGPQMPPFFAPLLFLGIQSGWSFGETKTHHHCPGIPSASQPLLLSGKIWGAHLLTPGYKKGQANSTVWRAAGVRGACFRIKSLQD